MRYSILTLAHFGNLRFSRLANFKNRSVLSGQEVVQVKRNSVWSITSAVGM